MSQKVIAIIPARGGSKTIPRKNIRLLAGRPLISYAIKAALDSKLVDKVVVSTEDDEIAKVANFCGAEVVERPENLAADHTPLDPVIFHALNSIEQKEGTKYNLILTIQPTSPLLSTNSIEKAVNIMWKNGNYDTLITVVGETHLYWTKQKNGKPRPMYLERKNRQLLEPIYRETGSLVISKREVVSERNRIGKKIYLLELPETESIDIDTHKDWWIAENILRRLKIAFRVDGDHKIGLGHIYRAITLANRIFVHQIFFLMDKQKKLGIDKVKESNYPIIFFKEQNELFNLLKKIKPHIIINDILDTGSNYISKLKKGGLFVVNFEDLGEGAEQADLVINALYENSTPPKNHYYGFRYECLRDEFYLFPNKGIKKEVKKILITFGGTDQNNLTQRTLEAIEKIGLKNIFIEIILGIGFKPKESLRRYAKKLKKRGFDVQIKENVKMMSEHIYNADIIVTSNGRTIYEVASIGTPCISISQNEREVRHLFSYVSKGIMNLGMAHNVTKNDIGNAIKKLIDSYSLRKTMNKRLLKYDIKKNTDKVTQLILNSYEEWCKKCGREESGSWQKQSS